MHDVFLCHSEKDLDIAIDVARGLEAAGYTTWYYKRDSLPGGSYLIQVGRAVLASRCIVLIASRHSLESGQVTSEIVRGYEAQIPFIPLLLGITHKDVQSRQEIWHQALVTWTSLPIDKDRIADVVPQVIRGLENLEIRPGKGGRAPGPWAPATLPAPRKEWALRRWHVLTMFGVLVAVGAVILAINMRKPHSQSEMGKEVPAPTKTAEPRRESANAPPDRETAVATGRVANVLPIAPSVGDTSAMTKQAPVVVADMVLVISDPTGIAEESLAAVLRDYGNRVVRRGGSSSSTKNEEQRALDGDNAAGQQLAREYGASALLIGRARGVDVASGYGLYAVRGEISVRLVDAQSGIVTGHWAASKKVALPDRARAWHAAIEGAVEELVTQMAAGPNKKKN